jgi:hypothetical protein
MARYRTAPPEQTAKPLVQMTPRVSALCGGNDSLRLRKRFGTHAGRLSDLVAGLRSGFTLQGICLKGFLFASTAFLADRFDRWIRHDVLEQVYETGSYTAPVAQTESGGQGPISL